MSGVAREQGATTGVVRLDLGAQPRAASDARRALDALLHGTPFEEHGERAALALSELVTNAVLHGHEPVSLQLCTAGDVLRAEVRDGSPLTPSFNMLDPNAVTGRGLLLVASVSDRWGLEPGRSGKTVWFEIDLRSDETGPLDVDDLLASWGEDVDDPGQEVVKVVLTELDVPLTARSEAHVEALLRELALVATSDDCAPALQLVAERVLQAAVEVEALRAEVKQQLSRAVLAGVAQLDVVLRVTRIDAETVRDFARAVDEADRLSRRGELLTQPAPPELSQARERYLQRVVNQLL
ncbi:MAG: ATP-binding region ATPase domain protein [Frankiales bacterium]|nr:ATP-binding region ATPase domain protein [Frankiales bacterium]